jgi:hypothetical protein
MDVMKLVIGALIAAGALAFSADVASAASGKANQKIRQEIYHQPKSGPVMSDALFGKLRQDAQPEEAAQSKAATFKKAPKTGK